MTIQLKPSGPYTSQDEVIDRALEVLHQQDEWLTSNRQAIDAKIRTGIEELERGECILDDELDAYLQRLKAQPE
jgi:Arc/MetJ-type ribon-helix-helix transcriptional regulator